MVKRKPRKPPEGKKIPDTPDMQRWRQEFESMSTEDHVKTLASLGLDDDDLEEFKEMESGAPLDEEIMTEPAKEDKKKKPSKKK